ncbi:RbsD/FucU family protein [Fusibacter sp. JL216-2]|uniref:RbsD/FucU family protein n=1 Tax=Fusibacter sp. JL216-2 TaxID=3071453 RepID=UPI003D34F188
MLKGIPNIISPDLLKTLHEMGHGDTLVIADGNFPAASCAKKLIRLDGHSVTDVLEAVLTLMPLDKTPHTDLVVMDTGTDKVPEIWREFEKHADQLTKLERQAFYKAAQNAYCIVSTSEKALFANVLLTKGVL